MQYRTTPEHAATQLLALEPLTFGQLRLYTGWDPEKARQVTNTLMQSGKIRQHTDPTGCRFWLASQLRAHIARQAALRADRAGERRLRRVA